MDHSQTFIPPIIMALKDDSLWHFDKCPFIEIGSQIFRLQQINYVRYQDNVFHFIFVDS